MKNLFGALANYGRLRMVRILLRGPLNVSEITNVLGLSQSNVSHSLRKLLDAGIVIRKGRGSWAYYSLNRNDTALLKIFDSISSGMKEIENYETDMSELRLCYAKRKSEAREFFDRKASKFDEVSYLMPDPEAYITGVINMYPEGSTILDVGCGRGELVLRLVRRGMSVIGVDQSTEMLSQAEKRIASEENCSSVELRLGSAEQLPLDDSSVDGIIVHMLLHHLSEPSLFFREAARVCKDNGRCSVIELKLHEDSDLKRKQGDLWPGLDRDEVRVWMSFSGFSGIEEILVDDGRVFILSGVLDERNFYA
ncbi:MAG: metalloregulator ArsR/SmtB family transcription factor [Candidatus Aegiribacteria sp.]|nr:metalloregulator ArsR/SmtB family transcription factor [Candidatus Aegiribacteria sp.]